MNDDLFSPTVFDLYKEYVGTDAHLANSVARWMDQNERGENMMNSQIEGHRQGMQDYLRDHYPGIKIHPNVHEQLSQFADSDQAHRDIIGDPQHAHEAEQTGYEHGLNAGESLHDMLQGKYGNDPEELQQIHGLMNWNPQVAQQKAKQQAQQIQQQQNAQQAQAQQPSMQKCDMAQSLFDLYKAAGVPKQLLWPILKRAGGKLLGAWGMYDNLDTAYEIGKFLARQATPEGRFQNKQDRNNIREKYLGVTPERRKAEISDAEKYLQEKRKPYDGPPHPKPPDWSGGGNSRNGDVLKNIVSKVTSKKGTYKQTDVSKKLKDTTNDYSPDGVPKAARRMAMAKTGARTAAGFMRGGAPAAAMGALTGILTEKSFGVVTPTVLDLYK